ncbi:MAG: AAA15 family ATPase/GTPase, partial [Phenylobacterium sp.]
MKLELQIKNFGKIQDATIKLRPFTLIAGANSCGKSFVTKSLYSFFNTMNKDHLGLAVIRVIQLCQSGLNYIEDQVKLDTFSLSSELTALKTSYQVFEAFVIAQFISKTTSEQLMVFP